MKSLHSASLPLRASRRNDLICSVVIKKGRNDNEIKAKENPTAMKSGRRPFVEAGGRERERPKSREGFIEERKRRGETSAVCGEGEDRKRKGVDLMVHTHFGFP